MGVPAAPPAPPAPADAAPAGGPGAEDSGGRALHHVTEQTRTYPCKSCGGQLEFDIATQKLKCPDCGGVQDIVEAAGRTVDEQDFRTALAALKANAAVTGPQLTGQKEVVCQSCGGHTTFTGTLTSTRCPYCATPIQRDDVQDAPSRLAIDGVVPFAVDARQAKESLEAWINGRWFAPSEFKKYNRTGSFASVYAAYFTYDAATATRYEGQRGDDYTVTVGSGDNQHTETRTRWYGVSGMVNDSFDDLCVLANDGLDRSKVVALEPWPTGAAKPFSAEFVAGHLCRTYDHDVEECFPEAHERMDKEIERTIERDIGGDHQRISRQDTSFQSLTFKHLLLPIWLLTVIYAGKPFQVFINGVTGEVQGERPWSKVKIAAATVVAVILIAVIAALYLKSRRS